MGIERRISVLNAMTCKVLLSADHQRGGSKCVDACVPPVFKGQRCCAGSRWLQVILLKQWDSDGWLHGGHEFCMQNLLGWGFLGIPWDSQDAIALEVQEPTSHCTQPSRIHRAPKMERIVYPARPSISMFRFRVDFLMITWIECT